MQSTLLVSAAPLVHVLVGPNHIHVVRILCYSSTCFTCDICTCGRSCLPPSFLPLQGSLCSRPSPPSWACRSPRRVFPICSKHDVGRPIRRERLFEYFFLVVAVEDRLGVCGCVDVEICICTACVVDVLQEKTQLKPSYCTLASIWNQHMEGPRPVCQP